MELPIKILLWCAVLYFLPMILTYVGLFIVMIVALIGAAF